MVLMGILFGMVSGVAALLIIQGVCFLWVLRGSWRDRLALYGRIGTIEARLQQLHMKIFVLQTAAGIQDDGASRLEREIDVILRDVEEVEGGE